MALAAPQHELEVGQRRTNPSWLFFSHAISCSTQPAVGKGAFRTMEGVCGLPLNEGDPLEPCIGAVGRHRTRTLPPSEDGGHGWVCAPARRGGLPREMPRPHSF